jgi:hypothetical protein
MHGNNLLAFWLRELPFLVYAKLNQENIWEAITLNSRGALRDGILVSM